MADKLLLNLYGSIQQQEKWKNKLKQLNNFVSHEQLQGMTITLIGMKCEHTHSIYNNSEDLKRHINLHIEALMGFYLGQIAHWDKEVKKDTKALIDAGYQE